MASAIVLCAGFGTRLRPLTDELPKPLAPIGDRSILEHALTRLRDAGMTEIVINLHHLAARFEPVIAAFEPKIEVVVETEIRGTAGGIAGAWRNSSSAPVLVYNGDIWVDPPVARLLGDCARDSFCFGVAPRATGEGTVGLDRWGHVVRLRGERFGEETSAGDYVGVLAVGAGLRDALPQRGCLFGDVALPLLRRGGTIRSVPVLGAWTDAGDLRSLLAANLAWLQAKKLESFVARSAEVLRGVQLHGALVGARARVLGEGTLERCVVCPGAVVHAPLERAIVAPSGRVIPMHD